jgi:hypothetical protein
MQLSWWETFIISAAVSFLTVLQSRIKNQAELAAIIGTLTFLQRLLNGQVQALS